MLTLLRVLLMLMAIVAARTLVPISDSPAQATLTMLLESSAAIAAMLLFAPSQRRLESWVPWCALSTGLATLTFLLDPQVPLLAARIAPFLLTHFALAATFAALSVYLAPQSLVGLFAFLALIPVWAGPLLEALNNPGWLNALVVGCSPLTAMAVALDADYLRSPWFYEHSAVASMRYGYPDKIVVLAVLLLAPLAALLLQRNKHYAKCEPISKCEPIGDVSS